MRREWAEGKLESREAFPVTVLQSNHGGLMVGHQDFSLFQHGVKCATPGAALPLGLEGDDPSERCWCDGAWHLRGR